MKRNMLGEHFESVGSMSRSLLLKLDKWFLDLYISYNWDITMNRGKLGLYLGQFVMVKVTVAKKKETCFLVNDFGQNWDITWYVSSLLGEEPLECIHDQWSQSQDHCHLEYKKCFLVENYSVLRYYCETWYILVAY